MYIISTRISICNIELIFTPSQIVVASFPAGLNTCSYLARYAKKDGWLKKNGNALLTIYLQPILFNSWSVGLQVEKQNSPREREYLYVETTATHPQHKMY